MKGTKIMLNDVEQRLTKTIGRLRGEENRRAGVKDARIGHLSALAADIEGFAGELAFCRLFNVYPDLFVKVTRTKDDFGDAVVDGKRIDVKTSTYDTARLLVQPWKKPCRVDAFALMTGIFPSYTYRGMMAADELLQEHRLRDFGHGKGYAADQRELK